MTVHVKLAPLALLLTAQAASAGSLSDAITRHDDADVATLRELRDDVAARCTLGAVFARRSDLSRAALYLTDCDGASLPAEVSADIAKAMVEVKKKIGESELSKVELVSTPAGMSVEFDALPGEPITTPQTTWIKAGTYELRGEHDGKLYKTIVVVKANSRASGFIDAAAKSPRPVEPKQQRVNFNDELHAEPETKGGPKDIKHPKLTAGSKWDGKVVAVVQEDQLEDPMAVASSSTRRAPGSTWLGVRVGAGMFDDGAANARPGFAVGVAARHALSPGLFAAARIDYSSRGGELVDTANASPIGALGVSAGVGRTVLAHRDLALAVVGQLRGDLRLGSQRAMDSVSRAGVSVAAGVELALPATPISAGLRFEQGLTTLAGDTRDRAFLLEIGVDWR